MNLVLKNFEVKALGDFLYEIPLKGKDSRMRSRFIAILETQLKLIQNEREMMMQDYAHKDEEGNPVTDVDDEGREFVTLKDPVAFNLETSKLMSEEFIIDITKDRVDIIKTVRDIVLNSDKELSGMEAERYNRFCDILESVSLEDTE